MPVAVTYSRAQIGIESPLVTVEAFVTQNLPQILIVGLPEAAVRESKDRVRAAISNSGFAVPGHKITVNLAPADLPKQGGRYDLAIALAIVEATEQLPEGALSGFEFMGELALDGKLREVRGVLPAAIAGGRGNRTLIVPRANGAEAALAGSNRVRVADSLLDVVHFLCAEAGLDKPVRINCVSHPSSLMLSDIRGQQLAKRALIVSAAGAHNLLFIGPPGTGKTMLASRLPALLPPLEIDEALEVASVQSVSKYGFDSGEWGRRPFRNPHHTASGVALVGGGNPPKPGEISLAHHGVLFLDELPEYPRHVLEVLREPLESGRIIVSRANHQATFPSRFQLIAAMNPCPCGYFGDDSHRCTCGIAEIERYRSRISGPLLDRIDMHVDVPALPMGALSDPLFEPSATEHDEAATMIREAQRLMRSRSGKLNAHITSKEAERVCALCEADQKRLDKAMHVLGLSARGYYKVLKVARTIADLSRSPNIETRHLNEALGFRRLDRGDEAGPLNDQPAL